MSSFHDPGSPAPSGFFGILRSWLQPRPGETRPPTEDLFREAASPSAQPHASVRVLAVDDNPANLMVISALLESRGLVPWLAADGAEAVSLASELPFDLILMDLQMPILDGLGATSAIRRFETLNSQPAVPVVAYSILSPGAGLLATHGFNGSLNKPCEDEELEDCLVRWCPTYRSASPMRGVANEHVVWQTASRHPDTRHTSIR